MSARPVRGGQARDTEALRALYAALETVYRVSARTLADTLPEHRVDEEYAASWTVAQALWGRDPVLRDLLGIPRLDPAPDPRQLDLLEGQ